MKNWIPCVVGLAVLGCAGKDEEFTSNDKADLALSDAPGALSVAVCEALFRCVPLQGAVFGTIEQCGELFAESFIASSFGLIEDAVEEERVFYDPEKAQECLDDLADAECSQIDTRSIDSCSEVFSGTVDRGGDCTLDEECVGDSFCLFGDSCPGTCSEFLAAGEACRDDENCEPGLVCSEATLRCVQPAEEGEACEQGAPQCAAPFICLGADEDAAEPGQCMTAEAALSGEEGDSCRFIGGEPVLCQPDLSCQIEDINVTDGIVSTCRPVVGEGDDCGLALPSMCPSGYYCAGIELEGADFSGTCEPLPTEGESCSDDLFTPCALGLICLGGSCSSRKENGESCTLAAECQSENCVEGGCAPLSPCE